MGRFARLDNSSLNGRILSQEVDGLQYDSHESPADVSTTTFLSLRLNSLCTWMISWVNLEPQCLQSLCCNHLNLLIVVSFWEKRIPDTTIVSSLSINICLNSSDSQTRKYCPHEHLLHVPALTAFVTYEFPSWDSISISQLTIACLIDWLEETWNIMQRRKKWLPSNQRLLQSMTVEDLGSLSHCPFFKIHLLNTINPIHFLEASLKLERSLIVLLKR